MLTKLRKRVATSSSRDRDIEKVMSRLDSMEELLALLRPAFLAREDIEPLPPAEAPEWLRRTGVP